MTLDKIISISNLFVICDVQLHKLQPTNTTWHGNPSEMQLHNNSPAGCVYSLTLLSCTWSHITADLSQPDTQCLGVQFDSYFWLFNTNSLIQLISHSLKLLSFGHTIVFDFYLIFDFLIKNETVI